MGEQKLKFYSLAKYPNYEIILDSDLQGAGANQAKLLERYEKNNKAIKNKLITLKIVFSLLLALLPVMPLISYFEIYEVYITGSYHIEAVIFVLSFSMSISLIMSVLYLFLFGLFTTGSFMSGNSFKWLQTLPISKSDMKKLGMVTIFHNLDIPLVAMTFSFPVVMLIGTMNITIFFTCLLVSFINVVFSFSILVIIGGMVGRVFQTSNIKSKKASILRMVTMIGFVAVSFSSGFIMQWAFRLISEWLPMFELTGPPTTQNFILSLIPFPFAPSYLISWATVGTDMPIELIITTVIGTAIFGLLTFILYRTAMRSLRTVVATEIIAKKKSKSIELKQKELIVKISTRTPVMSYIKKDLTFASRDIQTLMFIIMPIAYPFILILSLNALITEEVTSPEALVFTWAIIIAFIQFIPILLVSGLLNLEESGASTLASLPLVLRDQAKAKIFLILVIQAISLIIMAITITIFTRSAELLLMFVLSIPISWSFLFFVFELKVRFFGKMKYKYVLEEINKEKKIRKWILIFLLTFIFYFSIIFGAFIVFASMGILGTLIYIPIVGILSLIGFIFIFTRMFPKLEKLTNFTTGGLLRNIPILGVLILPFLYFGFSNLSELPAILVLLPLGGIINYTGRLIILTFFQFSFLALLFLYVIPRGFKLPKITKSFKDYTKVIGLSTVKPIAKNIFIGVISFAIYSFIIWIGANLLGEYTFDPSIIFRPPDPNLPGTASYGWFILVYMLIPGIWEEVAFRGVAIPMLQKKYTQTTTIVISGLVFGLAHSFNVILVILIGADPIVTLFQVIYATLFGFAFGYMFIKTKSLLPGMILHYTIDAFGLLFFPTLIEGVLLIGVYTIIFIGLIPSILIILLVKLFTWKNKRPFDERSEMRERHNNYLF